MPYRNSCCEESTHGHTALATQCFSNYLESRQAEPTGTSGRPDSRCICCCRVHTDICMLASRYLQVQEYLQGVPLGLCCSKSNGKGNSSASESLFPEPRSNLTDINCQDIAFNMVKGDFVVCQIPSPVDSKSKCIPAGLQPMQRIQ